VLRKNIKQLSKVVSFLSQFFPSVLEEQNHASDANVASMLEAELTEIRRGIRHVTDTVQKSGRQGIGRQSVHQLQRLTEHEEHAHCQDSSALHRSRWFGGIAAENAESNAVDPLSWEQEG